MRHAKGPLCSIDVAARESETIAVDHLLATYLGGRGLGTRLAYDRIPFDADPLGPENRLVFSAGPLQTSTTSFTGRTNCTGLSPLTEGLLSSNAGGFLSRNVADTGYAAIEFVGASDDLIGVHVRDYGVTFESVPGLAGADVSGVTEYVQREHDLDSDAIVCVGPAGEHRVRFAGMVTTDHRLFGRGGLGAVMGSKGVKFVTFGGDSRRQVSFPDVAAEVHRAAATSDSIMKRQGTAGLTAYANEIGALPTRYFSELSFEGADAIGGDRVEAKKAKTGTCSQCAFACKLPTRDAERGVETEGPEFETVMAFGSNAAIDDVVDVMLANDRCDELGLDAISCGDVIAAYLAANDEFGNADLVFELVEKIAHREGVGDRLAEGIDRCHETLGVENWSVKGMEFSAHDGRRLNGQGLAFATANRGADHLYASMYTLEYPLVEESAAVDPNGVAGKAPIVAERENHNAVLDSAIVCRFSREALSDEQLATLLDAEYERLQAVGERVVDLERAFNNRRGMDRDDDEALPYDLPGLSAALSEYYDHRGWNSDGTVPDNKLP